MLGGSADLQLDLKYKQNANNLFSNALLQPYPANFNPNRRRSSLQCPQQMNIYEQGFMGSGKSEKFIEEHGKWNPYRRESDPRKCLNSNEHHRSSSEATFTQFLQQVGAVKPWRESGQKVPLIDGRHRRSQPSLFYKSPERVYHEEESTLKHAPSQPSLASSGTFTNGRNSNLVRKSDGRQCSSSNVSPRTVVRTHPEPLSARNSVSYTPSSHYYTQLNHHRYPSPIGSILNNSTGSPGPGTPRRSLVNARATEKRILKRCPQSDLSYRVQRCKEYVGANPQNLIYFPQNNLNFQKFEHGSNNSNESTPSRSEEHEIDPVYLALKQATGKYGGGSGTTSASGSRRGSSAHIVGSALLGMSTIAGIANTHIVAESATPSPKNLSQISLQDSGYAEPSLNGLGNSQQQHQRTQLVGSTPQLNLYATSRHNSNGIINGQQPSGHFSSALARQLGTVNSSVVLVNSGISPPAHIGQTQQTIRRPKLSEKMKSLSLDCAEMGPTTNAQINNVSGVNSKSFKTAKPSRCGLTESSADSSDWERSCSPTLVPTGTQSQQRNGAQQQVAAAVSVPGNRRLPLASVNGTHVVIHEYAGPTLETTLFLGDRLHIVDNGDPDWLHGFRVNDRLEQLLTFPATCVTAIQGDEQPMKLAQNAHFPECKLRLYRDQVVFAQPDSLRQDQRILIRNERNAFVYCPLQYLILL